MKAILRSAVLAAGVASTLAMTAVPSSAQGAGVFTGEASINCFGCGVSSGTATLSVTGEVNGVAQVGASASATYTVTEIPSQCPVTGSANGTVSGAVNVTFAWTRVGATALITTSGDINGGGTAVFAVTSPVGNPCGGPVTANFAGAVAGA